MKILNLGYNKPLFILPFDHRSSFSKIFQDKEDIVSAKWIIYEAFKKALSDGIPKDESAILVDEGFGDKILIDAKNNGITTILTTEKSGEKEFTFEYGNDFSEHIEKYQPTFTKALIRYNPEDDRNSKIRQQKQLKILDDYCHSHGYKFLLEVLIEPKENQLAEVGNNKERYDQKLRPNLAIQVVKELQDSGVEPDVWKLEGMYDAKNYEEVINQIQANNRESVGLVILGRAESKNHVEKWIAAGAKVRGVIGFAVGRTDFWEPLVDLKNGKISKEETIHQIANNFKYFYNLFTKNKAEI